MQSLIIPPDLRLVVDANVLVGELLRQRGRDLIAHARLDLSVTERVWNEMEHELPRRIDAFLARADHETRTARELYDQFYDFAALNITQTENAIYAEYENKARKHIPHDPDDWPTVALALALDAAIWTEDRHFLGRGLAVWRTDALRAYLV